MHCNEGLLFPGRPEPTQARQVFGRAMNLVTSQQDKFDREVDRRASPPCRSPSLILPSCKQGLSAPTQAGTAIIAERFPPTRSNSYLANLAIPFRCTTEVGSMIVNDFHCQSRRCDDIR